MEIFHLVADQLKNTPIFESELLERAHNDSALERVVAILQWLRSESPFEAFVAPIIEPIQLCITPGPSLETEEIDDAIFEAQSPKAFCITGQLWQREFRSPFWWTRCTLSQ